MKQVIVVAVAAAVALASPDYESMFKAFKDKHTKVYASVAEEAKRFEAFTRNMKRAAIQQAANPLATFGANAYADRTEAELTKLHQAVRMPASKEGVSVVSAEARAKARGTSIDWRTKGAVGPVVQQGECGGDWAIAAAGNIEGVWAAAGNPFVSASAEEILACIGFNGCDGGAGVISQYAYRWLMQNNNGTIATAASFPFFGIIPPCPANRAALPVAATILGYQNIPSSEDAMAAVTLQTGPIAVLVDATSWETYTGGILTNCVSNQADYSALIVGYDDNNVPPYWIIKTSLGTNWGEEGYIRVQKGSNQCLITSDPVTAYLVAPS